MLSMRAGQAANGGNHSLSPKSGNSRSSGVFSGFRKVCRSVGKTVKGLRDWVTKAPNKKLKAFRIAVLVGMVAGGVCLGVAAAKVTPWVIAGGVLLGGGCLIYRCTRQKQS